MNFFNCSACGLIMSALGAPASAETTLFAPSFGLSWDMSVEEFSSQFSVDARSTDGDLLILTNSSGDEALPSNTDILTVIFWNGKLVKFFWASDNFTGDPFGSEGQEAYSELATQLSKKLGAGEEMTYSGLELWDEPDEFYQCLAYDGCGTWVTFWTNPSDDSNVAALQLIGVDRGVGYLTYGMEHPDWYLRGDKVEADDASKF